MKYYIKVIYKGPSSTIEHYGTAVLENNKYYVKFTDGSEGFLSKERFNERIKENVLYIISKEEYYTWTVLNA